MTDRSNLTRRDLLRRMGLLAAGAGLGLAGCTGLGRSMTSRARATQDKRPNFLFILTDDQRYDALGFYGQPFSFLKTPNMDRIRREGVLFQNAFVTISLCAPSRACFLTGAYSHTHGVVGNWGCELDPAKTPSYPLLLQKAGYDTGFIGKWRQKSSRSDPRPGFDYWLGFKGQGVYNNPLLSENGREFKAQGYMTDILTDAAVKFIRQKRDRPFSLCLWHKAIHAPFTPPERHKNDYASAEIPKPPNAADDLSGKPLWQRATQARKIKTQPAGAAKVPDAIPPAQWNGKREPWLNYFRCLNGVDDSVGQVLNALQETGQLDDTVIFFAGDNGFFLGEHHRGDKRLMYEESLRIPLLMRYPQLAKPGGAVEGMALNIDVAPTILDLAGVAIPPTMQGRSLRPLLEGKTGGWRTSFLYEYWIDMNDRIPRTVGVRTDDWKLARYPDLNDIDELYDLKNDPHELRNLSQSPEHAAKLADLRAELERLMKETGYRDYKVPTPKAKAANPPADAKPGAGKPVAGKPQAAPKPTS